MKRNIKELERTERQLNWQQLQLNSLINITQAINNNVSEQELLNIYKSFLNWEIGVKKMTFFVRHKQGWDCAISIGLSKKSLEIKIGEELTKYTGSKNAEERDHPLIKEFDVIIPVRHKDRPIAYALIGNFGEEEEEEEEEEDMYSKVQFITTITNIVAVNIENRRLIQQQLGQGQLKKEVESPGLENEDPKFEKLLYDGLVEIRKKEIIANAKELSKWIKELHR